MIDLLKILKTGDTIFSIVHGKQVKIKAIKPDVEMCIDLGNFSFNRQGSVIPGGTDCLLFPSEKEKTWDNFSPFKKGEHVLAFNDEKCAVIGIFAHFENGLNFLYKTICNGEFEYEGYSNCEYINIPGPNDQTELSPRKPGRPRPGN